MARFASVPFLTDILINLEISSESGGIGTLGFGVAFIAGLASFLSPCVLPLIPAFLAYLGTTVTSDKKEATAEPSDKKDTNGQPVKDDTKPIDNTNENEKQ